MDLTQIIPLAIGTALAVFYVVLMFATKEKYRMYTDVLDSSKHTFIGLYSIGFWLLDVTKYRFNGKVDQDRRHMCEIIHGKMYAEYYLRLNYAQKISVALYMLPLGFLLVPFLGAPLAILCGVVAMVLAYWAYDMQLTDEMALRDDEIARDLPDVLSKLALLVNAGMILREAWAKVSETGDSAMYREMRVAVSEMANGVPESEAITAFGVRCSGSEVKKFCSTLVQNLSKGNKELAAYLRSQSEESWEAKKHYARRKGEAASSKLMIPITIMLMGILIMVVIPIFAGFDI